MRRLYLLLAAVAVASAVLLPLKPKSCIDYCKCKPSDVPGRLQIIECDRPLILNDTTFRLVNKQSISVISFENVIISQIQESVFKGFTMLEDVLILNSKIGSIDDKAFNHIKRLKFADCGFEDSPNLFSEKLEEVHFGSCQIEEIPKLNGLLSLTFLNLTGNYIKDVGIETFAELFDLEELYLSNNEIFKLPANLFINNQDLNSLYLDHNPLKQFYLNTSENLETLSLSNCNLESFDERSTQRLSTLSELNLSNNKIKNLTGKALSHMEDLVVINLANNQLEQLDDDIFYLNPDLNKITLDGNKFTSLPNFFLKSGEVFITYTFSCNNCGLKTLSSSVFENMPGIMDLQLSHNDFINVDNMFQKTPSLKILDISHNNIGYISPLAFAKSLNLESLNIAGNPLTSLNPEVFAKNNVIREIDARNTSLEMLWSNKNKIIPSLNKLYVSDNKLTSLTIDDFKVMPNLISIDLNNNPLNFSDDFCELVNWMDIRQIRPIENTQDLDASLDGHYIENPNTFDGFSFISWRDFYDNKCPEVSTTTTTESWEIAEDNDVRDNDIDNIDNSNLEYDENEDDDDDSDYGYDDEEEDDEAASRYVEDENNNLARASYILSVTSVFILTALVVLTLAVTVTLTILRRNNNFNMHKANLPRLKIPMWHSTPGQKKHSGSVYRPLSEDLSGPKTPKLSRYEFTSTPTVHSSNP
ncbi:leucine-rich repeat-containing protein 15 [Anoplophora glabripennis]|uniref:leucine-rich repeat-containing protein 15 n=1 Tax=Anoplophora glabripennis TaxID=217634 RepID=UPI00087530F6|nr:leucine-rich repeat-containing protein 15 [Anoplophora glabripennis]XP_018578714.1 leucine-rich repeat-containing protein 15 [Anoplophora glabripennis]XP_018578715.1 leucine-rich repeat-containing protein 15 [Anoplophora glabripennis]XP_018578716.1 leucine-rich repeat-containing protein 15 [Anoplophora glabripennis]